MRNDDVKQKVARLFEQVATGLETGSFGPSVRIAVTGLGSEHGEQNVLRGCQAAARRGVEVLYLGRETIDGVTTIPVASEDEQFQMMERLIDEGRADGAVAMHYPFPIGVSTVGRAVAPATGKRMYLATTTGTSATDRVEAMVRNAVAGIATAKASGVAHPTVGLLNVDGARQTESLLLALKEKGYPIVFATSERADGGAVMRGNDILRGTPDVLVMDSLTGNVLTKMLSAASSGGAIETIGDGYGPGVGASPGRLVMIVSRASGSPVVEGAITFAAELVKGRLADVAAREFDKAEAAGLSALIRGRKAHEAKPSDDDVACPPKEIVTASLAGIEVMDLEDAVKALWKQGVYAESGMGCTGPIIRVSEANLDKAEAILNDAGYR